MKSLFRIALTLSIFLAGCNFTHAATVIMQPNKVWGPTNGLVGMWTFNGPDVNWTTGTAIDRSGQGNNGLIIGMATKTSPVAGKLGSALNFLTPRRINVGNQASLNDITQKTIAVWVRPSRFVTFSSQFILRKFDAGSSGSFNLYICYRGTQECTGSNSNTIEYFQNFSGSAGVWSAPTNAISLNKWTHIAITYDNSSSSNRPSFYINGVATTTSQIAPTGTVRSDSGGSLYIGALDNGTGSLFGSLDDVRIYNRVLSATEITQLYKAGQVVVGAAPAVKAGSGLVGWWTFDGAKLTSTTALDSSGQGNNGTSLGGLKPTPGKLGQAVMTTGTALDVGSASSLNDIQRLTVSAWVRPNEGGGGNMARKKDGIGLGWELRRNGTPFNFLRSFTGADGNWSTQGFPASKWTHVAVTYDDTSTANIPTFYINGIATTTQIGSTPTGSAEVEGSAHLTVSSYSNPFDGALDDVRIYNRILSAQEIKQLAGNGIVTITPFTCGVSTVKDIDGNVYNTLKIGTQCWMKQNMRVGTKVFGVVDQTNNSVLEKWCYLNSDSNCTNNNPNQPDGGLYQWNEAMQYSTTPGARGICPAGWHIPTHDQFTTLERTVCSSGSCVTDFPYDTSTTGYRGTNEGTKLKANGSSFFEANFAGYGTGGSFSNRSLAGTFWTSLQNGTDAWARVLDSGNATVSRVKQQKTLGYSVRCLKN